MTGDRKLNIPVFYADLWKDLLTSSIKSYENIFEQNCTSKYQIHFLSVISEHFQ